VDLLSGASVAGALRAVAAILAFGLTVVLGRILGTEATGVYFLAFTTVTVAATIGRVGMDNAVLRFIAAHASGNRWARVGRVYHATLAVGLLCSCLVAAALYLSSDFLANTVFSDSLLASPLRIMAVAVVPLSLGVLISKALLGLSRVRDSILVFGILPTGIALAGTWVLASKWGVKGASVAYVFAVSVALVYGWMAWRRELDGRSLGHSSGKIASPTRELLGSGIPLLVGDLLYLAMQVSGTLMLGIWADNVDVGQYAVAWRTAMLIGFVLLTFATIVQPKFAALYARGEMELLATTAQRTTLLLIAFSAPVSLLFFFAPGTVMNVFGNDFSNGATTLQILSVAQFINVAMGSFVMLLVMSGREREYRNVLMVSTLVVLTLNVVLIPKYGAVGAAIAATSAIVVQNILFWYYVRTKLGILIFSHGPRAERSIGDA
jgi:O-antigen/teichoic acid export membrane protein